MNADELARRCADPIQTLGMSFYFDDATSERAKTHGLNVYEFYGLGRAGTMGDVDTKKVADAFYFFDERTIDYLWTRAKVKADPVEVAKDYLQAAYAFADRTLGDVALDALDAFARAARRVVDALASGRCPLVDGYKRFPAPANPVHAAYLGTILLRELRGGLHVHAVREVGLSALEACYLQDPAVFALHGYREEDAPEVSEELVAKKARAEELTDDMVAKCFDVLGDKERAALARGADLMFEALANPVPVASST